MNSIKYLITQRLDFLLENRNSLVIDADTHISDLNNLAAPLRKQLNESPNYYHGRPISAEELIREMNMSGVDMSLTWQNPAATFYPGSREGNFEALLAANRYIYDASVKYPERFIPAGWTDPKALGVDKAREIVDICVNEFAFTIVKLNPAQNEFPIDSELVIELTEYILSKGATPAYHYGADTPYTPPEGLEKLEILQKLTQTYMFQSLDSCEKYGTMAAQLAAKLDETAEEADAYKKIGYANYSKGNYEISLEYFFRSEQLFFDAGDYLDGSVITNFIGDAYMQMGNYDKAIEYFHKTEESCDSLILNHATETSAKRLSGILYTNLGLLYYNLDSLEKPLKYFNQALNFAQQINDSIRITASLSNLGMVHRAQGRDDAAMEYYIKALDIATKINHLRYQSAILNNMANIHLEKGNPDSAVYYFRKAKKIIGETGDKFGMSLVNYNIAWVLMDQENYREALTYLKESLSVAKAIQAKKRIYLANELLAELFEKMGQPQKALQYYRQYSELRDSVAGEDTRSKIAELEIKYETEKKEKENIKLKKENEIKELHNLYLTIGLILLLLLVSLILYLLRKRTIAYRNLVNKNLELAKYDREFIQKRSIKPDDIPGYQPTEDDKNAELIQKFNNYMMDEKPYLLSDLKIDDICPVLGTNRTYLSKAINDAYHKNFSSVINEFRVKAARQILTDSKYDHLSIEAVGEMSGYNSKVAFHKNFKKITGLTPSYFKDSLASK